MSHLVKHAYYVGGAPSLVISRVAHHGMRDMDVDMYRDECYFYVLKSEYGRVLSMPTINPFPARTLQWSPYHRPRSPRCMHCYVTGHARKACPQAHVMNKAGKHGACTACASFDHAVRTCPERAKPTYVCMICNTGKHTMDACPHVRGYFTTSGGAPRGAVDVHAPHTQAQTRSRGAWSNRPPRINSHMHANQSQQQIAHTPSRAPLPHRHDPELADIVKMLREEVNNMRAQLAEQTACIKQLTATNAQQMQIIMQLTASNTHSTASGGVMIGTHVTDEHARAVSPSPAMTATSASMSAPKPRTPRLDPSQPSMLQFASPKSLYPTANAFTALMSTSAPTTPVASPRPLPSMSPITPIRDDDNGDTQTQSVSTPRSKKAGASNSGRKRVQSVSPSRSPVDDPVSRSQSSRRASMSSPTSASNLSERMKSGNTETPTPAPSHDALIDKLTKPAPAAKKLQRRK